MPIIRKLVCTFNDSEGKSMNLSYNYMSNELAQAEVKALMTGIIANGSIFARTPVTATSAKVVNTSEEEIDISD